MVKEFHSKIGGKYIGLIVLHINIVGTFVCWEEWLKARKAEGGLLST